MQFLIPVNIRPTTIGVLAHIVEYASKLDNVCGDNKMVDIFIYDLQH